MTRLEQLLHFLKDSPQDSFLNFAIAKEYEALDDKKRAFEYYHKLLGENEDYVGTYYHLGKLYEKINQHTDAIITYKKGMEIAQKQGDRHAYSELAAAKLELSDEDD
jgi:tetratricopeptide (TPR) repeat protein